MFKTHLAIGIFLIAFLLPMVNNKLVFCLVVLVASLLPDIDIASSYMGQKKIFRILQWFVKHRGIIHSFTFCIIVSLIFAFYIPILALPFFLGYSFHLLADSFTVEGIRPFWPLKKEVEGPIRVSGKREMLILIMIVVFSALLFVKWFV
jgi:inner membrane protein